MPSDLLELLPCALLKARNFVAFCVDFFSDLLEDSFTLGYFKSYNMQHLGCSQQLFRRPRIGSGDVNYLLEIVITVKCYVNRVLC